MAIRTTDLRCTICKTSTFHGLPHRLHASGVLRPGSGFQVPSSGSGFDAANRNEEPEREPGIGTRNQKRPLPTQSSRPRVASRQSIVGRIHSLLHVSTPSRRVAGITAQNQGFSRRPAFALRATAGKPGDAALKKALAQVRHENGWRSANPRNSAHEATKSPLHSAFHSSWVGMEISS
jgi:hypothetical protein